MQPCNSVSHAFTLIELLVVIAIIGILAALLLPAMSKAKSYVRSTHCESNLKQLQLAWLSYAHENSDRLVPNKARDFELIQRSVAPSWVLGNAKRDSSPTNIQAGLLFSHAGAAGVYHCPTNGSMTKSVSTPVLRIRSYSLLGWLGGDVIARGVQASTESMPQLFKARLGAIRNPSRTYAFLDDHEDSIDDGAFGSYDPLHWAEPNPAPEFKTWMELPSDRHNRGCNLSFADGHAEHWRWKWPKVFEDYDQPPANASDEADLHRLQACTPTR